MPAKKRAPTKKKSTARKSAAKKTARKSTAKKTAARKKSTARKSTAKRTAPRKKSTAKKSAARKKSTAKKTAARKKSTARKSTARKTAARKKSTARKSTAKKTSAARKTARRTTAKRSTAKKAAKRRSSGTGRQDVVAVIKQDHATVDGLFTRYQGLGDSAYAAKGRTVERLVKELSVHAAVEEQVLYPRIRQVVGRGDSMISHALDEHQEAKELLAELERRSPEDPGYDGLVTKLQRAIKEHVREEESEVLPVFAREVDRDELLALAEAVKKAKKGAPTRPHPWAPNTPPGNVVAGAVAGVMDRARDVGRQAVRGR